MSARQRHDIDDDPDDEKQKDQAQAMAPSSSSKGEGCGKGDHHQDEAIKTSGHGKEKKHVNGEVAHAVHQDGKQHQQGKGDGGKKDVMASPSKASRSPKKKQHADQDMESQAATAMEETDANLASGDDQKDRKRKSKYKGVYYNSRVSGNHWFAGIYVDGKNQHLGSFATEEEAARAYDRAAKANRKEKAVLNFPDEGSAVSKGSSASTPKKESAASSSATGTTPGASAAKQSTKPATSSGGGKETAAPKQRPPATPTEGVRYDPKYSWIHPWRADILRGGKVQKLGNFATAEEAQLAYEVACRKQNGIPGTPLRGVWRPPDANETTPYQAFITTKEGYRVVIGEFVTEEEAARAYDQEAKLLYKEKAMLNFGGLREMPSEKGRRSGRLADQGLKPESEVDAAANHGLHFEGAVEMEGGNTSREKAVTYDPNNTANPWLARLYGKSGRYVGRFPTEEDARKALEQLAGGGGEGADKSTGGGGKAAAAAAASSSKSSGSGDTDKNKNKKPAASSSTKSAAPLKPHKTSGYRGVYLESRKKVKPWHTSIRVNGKSKFLGYFDTQEEGARVYDEHARKAFGANATLNFPDEHPLPAKKKRDDDSSSGKQPAKKAKISEEQSKRAASPSSQSSSSTNPPASTKNKSGPSTSRPPLAPAASVSAGDSTLSHVLFMPSAGDETQSGPDAPEGGGASSGPPSARERLISLVISESFNRDASKERRAACRRAFAAASKDDETFDNAVRNLTSLPNVGIDLALPEHQENALDLILGLYE